MFVNLIPFHSCMAQIAFAGLSLATLDAEGTVK